MRTIPDLRGVLFDKDGTLLDFAKTWGPVTEDFLTKLSEGDTHLYKRYAQAIGFKDHDFAADSVMIAHTGESVAAVLKQTNPSLQTDDIIGLYRSCSENAKFAPIGELRSVFKILKGRGLRLGVISNDEVGPTRTAIDVLGLAEFVEVIIGCDSGFGVKPEPGPCLAAAEALNIDPAQSAYIGDNKVDMEAARAAGMTAVGVMSGYLTVHDFVDHADFVLPDVLALPAWLSGAPLPDLAD